MTDEQVEALSRAVLSTDAARRVGWAKAYSAEATKDELSREINMLRTERDLMRRSLSFLHGFIQAYAAPNVAESLGSYFKELGAVLDSKVVAAGVEVGEQAMSPETDELIRLRKAQRKANANANDRYFKTARERERKLIMKRFGIPNEAALWNHLVQYGQRRAEP